MKYLLDIPALMAWQHARHQHSAAFHRWIAGVGTENVATCAHVELGFIRVSMQTFKLSIVDASKDLAAIRARVGRFIVAAPPPKLPSWVNAPAQTSDGYLSQIAAAEGMKLATFDAGIPGAELIPP